MFGYLVGGGIVWAISIIFIFYCLLNNNVFKVDGGIIWKRFFLVEKILAVLVFVPFAPIFAPIFVLIIHYQDRIFQKTQQRRAEIAKRLILKIPTG